MKVFRLVGRFVLWVLDVIGRLLPGANGTTTTREDVKWYTQGRRDYRP